MRSWITMFNGHMLPEEQRGAIVDAVEERLRPTHYRDRQWRADYRRLRITAVKR